MTSLVSKTVRAAGACAVLALSVFSLAPKPAEACFPAIDYVTECSVVIGTYCSYHADGSGGLYEAKYAVYYCC
jgi:hypothetical protein